MAIRVPTANALVRDCLRLLALRKVRAWRNNAGALGRNGQPVKGSKGSPDILAILPAHRILDLSYPPGRLLGVECKTGTGKLDADQRQWHETARAAGVAVVVVRSFRELDDYLHSLGAFS